MTNPLNQIVPARYRVKVYAVLTLLLLGWTVYQASEGDWRQFVGGLLVALTTGTAASNTRDPE
jgi:hypothetical protein